MLSRFNIFLTKFLNIIDTAFPIKKTPKKLKTFTHSSQSYQIKESQNLIQESYNKRKEEDLKAILKSYKAFYLQYIQDEKKQ